MTKEVEPALAKCFQVVFTSRVPSDGPLKLEKTKNKFTARMEITDLEPIYS